ncbi:MAG: hypothetical protein KIS96_12050 [Bauldia sp.]|nr:hypothetical protein [Bauldia sp.]
MRLPLALSAALAAIVAAAAPASAQSGRVFQVNPDLQFQIIQPARPLGQVWAQNRVYLSCQVVEEKRAVITNTTGAPTPEHKTIYLEIVTIPDGQRIVQAITDRTIPPGQYIAPGIPSSSACYAWYEQEPMMMLD